jgi:hypothetical protein
LERAHALACHAVLCFNAVMVTTSSRFALSRPVLASVAAALLFGASTPLAKALLSSIAPLTLAGLLYLGGAIGALPFAFRGGSGELRRDPRQRRLLAFAVIFGGGLAPVLLLLGLRAAPAASVSLWLNTEIVGSARSSRSRNDRGSVAGLRGYRSPRAICRRRCVAFGADEIARLRWSAAPDA